MYCLKFYEENHRRMRMEKNIITIGEFGAVANTTELQTGFIQEAIDHCFLIGGGEVIIPGGVYLVGDIRLRSRVTLHLLENAVLKASRNPLDFFNYRNDSIEPLKPNQITDSPYISFFEIGEETAYEENNANYEYKRKPGSRWNNAIIRAIDADDIKIIGEKNSIIDGDNCFDELGEEGYRGPHGICFFNCSNVWLSGYTIQNTGNWAHNILFSKNIEVSGITVKAGHDGFDAFVSENISITDSEFYTGDDSIAGYGNVNVTVKNCELNSSCSAMRFGGTNVLVQNCHIYGPGKYCFRGTMPMEMKKSSAPSLTEGGRNNMLSAFTYYADYSMPIKTQPGNIVICDCTIENADRFLHYNFSGNEVWQQQCPLKNITFENIIAENVAMPLTAFGDSRIKIDLKLSNVKISMRDGCTAAELIHACNYDRIALENVDVINSNAENLITVWSDGKIDIENVNCNSIKQEVKKADCEFVCNAI